MLASTYIIIGRYMKGVRVIGYEIEAMDGSRMKKTKKEVEHLALNRQIINCTAQRYVNQNTNEETIVLKGVSCKLSSLPSVNINKANAEVDKRGEIIERIADGKNTVGYVVLTYTGEKKSIKRDKTIQLAREGAFKNARAQLLKDDLLLRGVGCDLAKLPVRKVSDKVRV